MSVHDSTLNAPVSTAARARVAGLRHLRRLRVSGNTTEPRSSSRSASGSAALLLICLTAIGCESMDWDEDEETVREPPERPATEQQTPSAPAATWDQTVGTIVRARCEREQRCGNIEPGGSYSSMDECVAQVRNDWADELNAYQCSAGVEHGELAECLTEIRNEDCGNPLDTLGRIVACRSSDICDRV